MKSNEQIIQETYDKQQEFRDQLAYYELSLDDVGVVHMMNSDMNISDNHVLGVFDSRLPIVLLYSLEDDEAFSYCVDLYSKNEELMRKKRLAKIGK